MTGGVLGPLIGIGDDDGICQTGAITSWSLQRTTRSTSLATERWNRLQSRAFNRACATAMVWRIEEPPSSREAPP